MSSPSVPISRFFSTPRKTSSRRGWPVVATGTPGTPDLETYMRWRTRLGLPDESADFSDRDVFDVALFLIERDARPDWPRLVVKALHAGPESVRPADVRDFLALQDFKRDLLCTA